MSHTPTAPGEWSLDVSATERRTWRVQRLGWTCMALLMGAALLGALGGGPLAWREGTTRSATVAWPAVLRLGTPATLTIETRSSVGPIVVTLDSALLSGLTVDHWIPTPRETRAGASGIEVSFARMSAGPATVRLVVSPRRIGRHRGQLLVGRDALTLTFLTLP